MSSNEEYYDAEFKPNNDFNEFHRPDIDWGSRDSLPAVMFSRENFGIWGLLKQFIGKELSKITMPLQLNEPLSFLQRISEYLEYSDLITKAVNESDAVRRLELVAAFVISGTASNWDRLGKPFNPLLGETYELHGSNYVYVAEQVSHHPPISAFYAEGNRFHYHGSVYPKLTFWGRSVQVSPIGVISLEIPIYDEVYSWTNVDCYVHNIIIGKLWVEHKGKIVIRAKNSGLSAELTFHPSSLFQKDSKPQLVDGYICSSRGEKLVALYGRWTQSLFAVPVAVYKAAGAANPVEPSNGEQEFDGDESAQPEDFQRPSGSNAAFFDLGLANQRLLWRATPRPDSSRLYYNFTRFALALNDRSASLLTNEFLPSTDCRFRPDINLMERGLIDDASDEKVRLENKQRLARNENDKALSSGQQPAVASYGTLPLWFRPGPLNNPKKNVHQWIFDRKYFQRPWQLCPNIY